MLQNYASIDLRKRIDTEIHVYGQTNEWWMDGLKEWK